MQKYSFKIATSTLIILTTLNACGINNNVNQVNNDQNVATYNNPAKLINTKPAEVQPDILSQINSLKIEESEWGINVKSLPVVKNKNKVTLLSYLAFDNNKGGWRDQLRTLINYHELSGSSSNMNMLLQTDTPNYQDLKRYFIIGDADTSKMVSPHTSFKYEKDSADYRVMKAFMKWCFSNYPSQIKMLDIDSHGGAFMGIAQDESSNTKMSLPNITKAIKESVGKVDVLNFDACLMGSVEVIYEVKDVADVVVGSQDSTLGTGMLYTKAMPSIIENSKTVDEIGKNIILASDRQGIYKGIESLVRPNRKGKEPNVYTISAYKAKNSEALVSEIDKLSRVLLKNISKYKGSLKSAFDGTHFMNIDADEAVGQRDLYEVLSRINTLVTDSTVKTSIEKTRNALNKTILLSRTHNSQKHSQGMAINISPISISSSDYKATAFAKDTKWDELVTAINN